MRLASPRGPVARHRGPAIPVMRKAFHAESNIEAGDSGHKVRLLQKSEDVQEFLAQALQRVIMFDGLSDHQISRIISAMEPCRFNPREVAARAGEPVNFM